MLSSLQCECGLPMSSSLQFAEDANDLFVLNAEYRCRFFNDVTKVDDWIVALLRIGGEMIYEFV